MANVEVRAAHTIRRPSSIDSSTEVPKLNSVAKLIATEVVVTGATLALLSGVMLNARRTDPIKEAKKTARKEGLSPKETRKLIGQARKQKKDETKEQREMTARDARKRAREEARGRAERQAEYDAAQRDRRISDATNALKDLKKEEGGTYGYGSDQPAAYLANKRRILEADLIRQLRS